MPHLDLPKRASNAEVTISGAVAMIHVPESPVGFELNQSAFAMWNLCDGNTTMEEMAGAISELTGISVHQALDEVIGVIGTFEEAGLVE